MPDTKEAPNTPETKSPYQISFGPRRYYSKGYGFVVAVIISVIYCYYQPILTRKILEYLTPRYTIVEMSFIMSIGCHSGLFFMIHGITEIVYWLKWDFFERYKILVDPWPWESDPKKYRELTRKTIINMMFNHFVILPLVLYADSLIGIRMRFDLESFPSYGEILSQLVFFCLVDDFFFYWLHRSLHHPILYPYVHKIHHEYTIPLGISAEYAHWFEHLFGNTLCTISGVLILGSKAHVASYLFWGIIKIVQSVDAHTGYEFSWSPFTYIPGFVHANYHIYHHYRNVGNFQPSFTFWDTLCGTNKVYREFMKKSPFNLSTNNPKIEDLKKEEKVKTK